MSMRVLTQLPDELFASILTCMYEVAPLWQWLPQSELPKYFALKRAALDALNKRVHMCMHAWYVMGYKEWLNVSPCFTLCCMVRPQGIHMYTALPPLPLRDPLRWYDVYLENMIPNVLFRKARPVRVIPYRVRNRKLCATVEYETGKLELNLSQPHPEFHTPQAVFFWKWRLLEQGDAIVYYTP